MLLAAILTLGFQPRIAIPRPSSELARSQRTHALYAVAKDEWGEAAPSEIGLTSDELSWQSPGWLWGNPSGESYQAIKAMRMEFGERSVNSNMHRKYFLEDLAAGVGKSGVDWMDVKVALAMCCMKAIESGDDEFDWAGFLEDMILCRFEGELGTTDTDQLRIALSTRLDPPPPLDEPLEKVLLRAFEVLKFQTRGI